MTRDRLSLNIMRTVVPLLIATLMVACGPVSKPATGEVADAVSASIASGTEGFDHSAWDAMMVAGTNGGLVDYGYFRGHDDELKSYLASLAEADLASLLPDHLMALLINAYNAYTVQSILDHPDTVSIKDIDGVWDTRLHRVGGFELTLDNMEHNLLRPFFKDPRIHVAVNCASQSCAPLPPWAFDGDLLEDQLEEWTTNFFNDPKYTRLEGDALLVSKLLDWYGGDFVAEGWTPREDTLAEFIKKYATGDVLDFLNSTPQPKIAFLDYDWGLNQTP